MSFNKIFRLCLTLTMMLSIALSASPVRVAQADTITVCASGCDYTTLQAGINAASASDTVNVAAGTYTENVIVNKSVTLAGAGAGSTIVQPAVSNPNCGGAGGGSLCAGGSNVFLVQADNVIIHDLTVDGDNLALTGGFDVGGANVDARNGIITNHAAGVYNGLEVYNVTVKNIYLRGMYASSGGTFNFHDNTVTNVQAEYASIAMFAYGGGPGIMSNNTVSYANDAISANHSKGIQFLHNTVTFSGSGVHTDNSGDGGGVADLIEGNNVDCTGKPGAYGVWVFVPYIAPTLNNNTVTNCDIGLSAWGTGAAVTTQFTNNTVTGNLAIGGVGAYVTTSMAGYGYSDVYADFSGNIITNYETGVYLDANKTTWDPEPYVAKNVTATFHSNQIHGNTKGADKGTTGTYIANFENNWWGAANGPSGVGPGAGDSVVAGLDYSPWCADVACTPPSLTFNPTSATLDVGSHTTVNIDLNLITDLYGYQFQVSYDSSKVSAVGVFVNSFFDTATPDQSFITWNADCSTTPGVCKFAVSKQALGGLPVSGSGTLAQITFTGVSSGIVPLTFTSDILGDRDGNALPHTVGTATLTVNGSATVSGVVNLQGRTVSGGTVTLTTAGFGATNALIAANGSWSAVVPVAPGGSTYQLDAAHSLYLSNQLTGVALTPGASYTAATTKLLGGDADNSGLIDVSDLSCIGGAFGGGAVTCGTGSSDINADGSTNILDLVLAGGNFELFTPRGW